MATIGQSIPTPEVGWKRYEQDNSNITSIGSWTTESISGTSGGTQSYTADTSAMVRFNFVGSKLRIIGSNYSNRPDIGANVYIDNVKKGTISQLQNYSLAASLDFDITGLTNKEHYVEIQPCNIGGSLVYVFDAIDIDETGELKPYPDMYYYCLSYNVGMDTRAVHMAAVL